MLWRSPSGFSDFAATTGSSTAFAMAVAERVELLSSQTNYSMCEKT